MNAAAPVFVDDLPGPTAFVSFAAARRGPGEGFAPAVESVLQAGNRQHYLLHAWCVLGDHVHAVMTPLPGHCLGSVVSAWKGDAARRLGLAPERLWLRWHFHRPVASADEARRWIRWVERSPVKAGLAARPEDWRHGSARWWVGWPPGADEAGEARWTSVV